MEINDKFNVVETAYDRWNSTSIITHLIDEGLTMEPFGQGFASMSAPTKLLETFALKSKLSHAGNEVLRWMCSNVEINKDPAGNIKIDKGKSSDKVDGMVALVMALDRASREIEAPNIVETW